MARPTKYGHPFKCLAQLCAVSDTTLRTHVDLGAPTPPHSKSERDLLSWIARYHEWRRAHGKVQPQPREVDQESERWSRERRKWLAMLARLEFAVQMRELVPRREVIDFASRACFILRNRMLALPDWCASRFALAEQGREELVDRIHRELECLADEGLDDGPAAPPSPDATTPAGDHKHTATSTPGTCPRATTPTT